MTEMASTYLFVRGSYTSLKYLICQMLKRGLVFACLSSKDPVMECIQFYQYLVLASTLYTLEQISHLSCQPKILCSKIRNPRVLGLEAIVIPYPNNLAVDIEE